MNDRLIATLKTIFKRDLQKLKDEIELYQQEEAIWLVDKSCTNSGGNLCLHILGNLNTYIGAGLAETGYIRKRDLEFSLKHIAKTELINNIDKTILIVEKGLNTLTTAQLENNFPIVIWEKPTEMGYTLIHLATHLNYHLGQINYHRKFLDKGQ